MPAAAFWLSWAFSFCGCVFLYAVFVFVRSVAFLAALRLCFSFRVAFAVLLFVLGCSVIGLFLSLLRFVGVGSILYRSIFFVACRRFILALNGIPLFCHNLPYFDKNITKSAPMDIDKNFTNKNGRLLFSAFA